MLNSESTKMIHVALRDEGTDCWRPVKAEHVESDLFRIVDVVPEDEQWAFQPENVVSCEQHEFNDGPGLVTVEVVRK
jgi:hypothetical protein